VRAVECAEILALDVFNRADGRPVTMSMVLRRLGELATHRPDCGCGLCSAAARVSADRGLPGRVGVAAGR
jgi:hypothetical protein